MERDKFVELVKKWHDILFFDDYWNDELRDHVNQVTQEMRDFVCPLGAITDEDREWARKVTGWV